MKTTEEFLADAKESARKLTAYMVFVDEQHQTRVEEFLTDCVLMCNYIKTQYSNKQIEYALENILQDIVVALKPPSSRIAITDSLKIVK